MPKKTIHYLTLTEVSQKIRSKEMTSVVLTQLILDRIDELNPTLNAYINVMSESALHDAVQLDIELNSGKYRGPLHGIPIGIKDLIYTLDAPTTNGQSFKSDFNPNYNATLIDRLKEAGAIIIGKLNLCEGAWSGYHPDFKVPINPWGDFWAGESSSGSGVATAAGLCFGAISTDTAGSIRLPSLANGVVGLKPTYGLVSRYGVEKAAESMDHVGTMARSSADAAILLQAIAGFDPQDASSLDLPAPHLLDSLDQGIEGIRIGVDKAYIIDGVDPYISKAIQDSIVTLEKLGAEIIPIQLLKDKDEQNKAGAIINAKEVAQAHAKTFNSNSEEYGPYLRDLILEGRSVSLEVYSKAQAYREDFKVRFYELFENVDVIISPAGGISPALPESVLYGPKSGWKPYLNQFNWHFAIAANLAGTPSLTLPCGEAKLGPPPGMQIMGNRLSEALLCRIGNTFEKATNWNNQNPNV